MILGMKAVLVLPLLLNFVQAFTPIITTESNDFHYSSSSSSQARRKSSPLFETCIRQEESPNDTIEELSTGPPLPIKSLPCDANIFISRSRPFFDPSFDDMTKPQQHSYHIARVGNKPDVFHLRGFLTKWECSAIMNEAQYNYDDTGMNTAKSENGDSFRTNCKVAWLSDARIGNICGIIGKAIENVFVTDEVKTAYGSHRSDLQVLNYKEKGGFVLHHDGHDRILTVIMYLNGVGETWLPLVEIDDDGKNSRNDEDEQISSLQEALYKVQSRSLQPGKDGVLISGSVKDDSFIDESSNCDEYEYNPHVVPVEAGDAIAFYSYGTECKGEDWKSIHAGIPLEFKGEEGKWIATSWYHAPSITC
ncbi:hypothetical protein CTEN210_17889 [Chaetoceros tenuissimus]|uniref:Fe2OG dioxygenase domain-containing protein n=1 Tax=Chaetoceros tenuissimus TaxID=426638 RepID=A0AAD3HFT8_9STRA|nr:hypothetical protein CTEN210_17889 [Chaetoceros tenuissimus]